MAFSRTGWVVRLCAGLGAACRHLVELLVGETSPWDRGALEAHWMHNVRTHEIEARLWRSRQDRDGLVARSIPWRRRYLDGLIWGMENELKRRGVAESQRWAGHATVQRGWSGRGLSNQE